MFMVTQASTVASAFVFRGPWQAERGFPCRQPQAKHKSPLRPFYTVLRPFAGAWLRQSLGDPLASWGQCSFRHGSCTDRSAWPWLGRGSPYFGRMPRRSSFVSCAHSVAVNRSLFGGLLFSCWLISSHLLSRTGKANQSRPLTLTTPNLNDAGC